jgi:RNA polymerase sigma factor (TIGR02999 family)
MKPDDATEAPVTGLLLRWREGDEQALEELMPLVYEELRRLARLKMRGERRNHTLQATALVHEAFVRLVDVKLDWQDRAHFLCIAARLIRRVLVDHARSHNAAKRGRGAIRVSLHEEDVVVEPLVEVLGLDEALERLQAHDSRCSQVIELHYFGGLTYREIAEVLDLSEATVDRDMRFARAWLRRELDTEPQQPTGR